MAEAVALYTRVAASAALTEAVRALNRYKAKPDCSIRILKAKYKAVVVAKDELMSKHFLYAEKAKKYLSSAELVEWLTPKMDETDDVFDEVYLILEEDEAESNVQKIKQEKSEEIKIVTLQSNVQKKRIETLIQTARDSVNDPTKVSVDDALLVESQLEQIDKELESLTKSWNVLKMSKVNADEDEELKGIFTA